MRNYFAIFAIFAVIFTVILVDQKATVAASPTPIFFSKLSRFYPGYRYSGDSFYPQYYGGSYGGNYQGGNIYGNTYGYSNRQSPDRQARGRSYSDICKVYGRPGIQTGGPIANTFPFCPYR